ncbi:MAG: sel1 repeat family protein [Synergistaceae bacterium]|nr:sel1 repeat family protein [Synergistaceae bacterium]
MRKIFVSLLVLVMLTVNAHAEDSYDPQHTMLALNMAVVSVHRILSAQDRIILDAEYQNIINNLSIGNIRSDPEITGLYRKLLDSAQGKKLRQEEAAELRRQYDNQSSSRIKSALSEMAENSRKMLTGETGISSFFTGLGRLAGACMASYFKHQSANSDINLGAELYRLKAEDMADFNDLQKQLLSSSWELLNKYHLPDEYRLVQRALDDFYRAVEEPDTASRRLRMLKALEDDFRVYPPYWYYRAKTAQEVGDIDETEKSFARFNEAWRPVLRKDPYMLEAVKYRINTMLADGIPDDARTRDEILALAGTMRDNTLREDWENNLYAAALYYTLGDKESAMKCAEVNLDFGYESELTSAMISQMRAGVAFPMLPEDTLRAVKLNAFTAGMTSQDREAAFIVADFFDGRDGASERLAGNDNPLAVHARRIDAYMRADGSAFGDILGLAEIPGDFAGAYSGALEMVQDYADRENVRAEIYLADMYNYGLGTDKDSQSAMKYYRLAGVNGDIYSQFMYVNLALMSRDYGAESQSPEALYSSAMRHYNRKDYAKAAEIFTLAAEEGHPQSQYMIGRMYEHGQGVSKNIDTAREWYTKAADNGESRAKKAMNRLSGKKSWWPF